MQPRLRSQPSITHSDSVLAPPPENVRPNIYAFAARHADAAINAATLHFARRGATVMLVVASAPGDSAFEVVSSARSRVTSARPVRRR